MSPKRWFLCRQPGGPRRDFVSLDLGAETAVVEGRHPRDHAHQLDRTAAAARTHPHRRDHLVPYWDELLWLDPDVDGLDVTLPDGQELGLPLAPPDLWPQL